MAPPRVLAEGEFTEYQRQLLAFIIEHGGGSGTWFRGGMQARLRTRGRDIEIDPASLSDLRELALTGCVRLEDLNEPGAPIPPIEYQVSVMERGRQEALRTEEEHFDIAAEPSQAFSRTRGHQDRAPRGSAVGNPRFQEVPSTLPVSFGGSPGSDLATAELLRHRDELAAIEASEIERAVIQAIVIPAIDLSLAALQAVHLGRVALEDTRELLVRSRERFSAAHDLLEAIPVDKAFRAIEILGALIAIWQTVQGLFA